MNQLLLLSHFSDVRLCDPTDGSPPGSPIPGILQARTLEWVAISFSNACMHSKLLQSCLWISYVKWSEVAQSCPTLCDPWAVAHQAPPSMGFSRQEYWSGLPLPSPGDLPDPGIEPRSPALQADALTSAPPGNPWISYRYTYIPSLLKLPPFSLPIPPL